MKYQVPIKYYVCWKCESMNPLWHKSFEDEEGLIEDRITDWRHTQRPRPSEDLKFSRPRPQEAPPCTDPPTDTRWEDVVVISDTHTSWNSSSVFCGVNTFNRPIICQQREQKKKQASVWLRSSWPKASSSMNFLLIKLLLLRSYNGRWTK